MASWYTGFIVYPNDMVPVCQSQEEQHAWVMLGMIPTLHGKTVKPGRYYPGTKVNEAVEAMTEKRYRRRTHN